MNVFSLKNKGPIKTKPTKKRSAKPIETRLLLFNKPFNTLCQFTGEANDITLRDFIKVKDIYAAGRLDKDSEGLLLLTNDGKLQHRISHPKHKLAKTYWVQVEGAINQQAIERLERGITLNDGQTKPAKARFINIQEQELKLWDRHPPIRYRKDIPSSWLELTIKEGRNRQVRRMTAAVGYPTLRLIRISIGKWKLGTLLPGEYTSVVPE